MKVIRDEGGAIVDYEYPDELLGHDDRCNFPAGGGCSCAEWERFDHARSEAEDGPCACGYGSCYGDCEDDDG